MEILSQSKTINHEYCASIVKVSEVIPIENSDFLAYTMINGKSIVVRKDEISEGDILFYADTETVLNEDFLGANNLYEASEFDRNRNASEVGKLLTSLATASTPEEKEKIDSEIKSKTGFFTKQSRVRMIKLRGIPSMGFLFSKEAMIEWHPEVKDLNMEDHIGEDFDTVCGDLFIKVYVPKLPETSGGRGFSQNRQKKVERFDKIIPGQFFFHYDTQPLGKNISRINPTDIVCVSVKIHGTSAIYANVLTKRPKEFKLPFEWLTKIVNKLHQMLPFKWQKVEEVYDLIYSSRNVIKNQYINSSSTGGYYKVDVWKEYCDLLKDYISEGMTVYGEIFGYETNSQRAIQKEYDYGCQEGTNKFMPYRITTPGREWEVSEIKEWTLELMKNHPEIADRLFPIDVLYEGSLEKLYPNLSKENHWHESVLQEMSNEKRWLMEKREPLCKNKVPREGVVLRIVGDPLKEAFKLKTNAFLLRERGLIDQGEVDPEMAQAYSEEEGI